MINFELEEIDKNIIAVTEEILPDNTLISFLSKGSKRIRARLAFLLLKAFEKTSDRTIYDIITAGELIHNASLLHDDVVDNSELRRGTTTLCKKYSSNISILCGDYVVSAATKLLININNTEIFNIFNNCVKDMASAEVKQYFIRGQNPDINTYLEICKGKTAGLFKAILRSCALYLNMDKELFEKFGELFGIAFQINNDLESFSAKEDKKNNIHTAVDVLGIENTNILLDNYKQELRVLLKTVPDNRYRMELEDIIEKL